MQVVNSHALSPLGGIRDQGRVQGQLKLKWPGTNRSLCPFAENKNHVSASIACYAIGGWQDHVNFSAIPVMDMLA